MFSDVGAGRRGNPVKLLLDSIEQRAGDQPVAARAGNVDIELVDDAANSPPRNVELAGDIADGQMGRRNTGHRTTLASELTEFNSRV